MPLSDSPCAKPAMNELSCPAPAPCARINVACIVAPRDAYTRPVVCPWLPTSIVSCMSHQRPTCSHVCLRTMVTPRGGTHVSGSRHHVLQAGASAADGSEIHGPQQARQRDGHGQHAHHDRRVCRTVLDRRRRDRGEKHRRARRNGAQVDGRSAFSGSNEGIPRSDREGETGNLSARKLGSWLVVSGSWFEPPATNYQPPTRQVRRSRPDSPAIPFHLRQAAART